MVDREQGNVDEERRPKKSIYLRVVREARRMIKL